MVNVTRTYEVYGNFTFALNTQPFQVESERDTETADYHWHSYTYHHINIKMSSPHDELCPPPSDDDDLTLPRASLNKMIKELV